MNANRPGVPHSKLCGVCVARSVSFCHSLTEEEIEHVESIVRDVSLPTGSMVFSEGQDADRVYNIKSGGVKVYKLLPDGRRQMTGFMFMGDYLGLAGEDIYSYSAETMTQTVMCSYKRSDLDRILEEYPHIERELHAIARHELEEAQEQMLLLGRKTAVERLASFIAMLSRRAVHRGRPGTPVNVPMGQNDIGDFLGLTAETVSRTLSRLKQLKVISPAPDRKINIIDAELLKQLSVGK